MIAAGAIAPVARTMHDPRFRDSYRAPPPRAEGTRLEKALADAGVFSRRDAEFAIRAGRVRLNGRRVTELPCLVDPARDLVELDGEIVDLRGRHGAKPHERIYLMLHKPKGVISTARDPGGRANVVDMVRAAVPAGERVYPVGRLDADSTGLVLLTNDGELAHRLAHPSSRIEKEYRVAVQGSLSPAAASGSSGSLSWMTLAKGMFLADRDSPAGGARRARMKDVRVLKRVRNRRDGDLSLVSVTLTEGQNREIRRLFARVGVRVRSLERISLGSLELGRLPRGHFRALRGEEILALRRAVRLG